MIARLTLSRSLPWFDGHFPGRPVLPGVALLSMLAEHLGTQGREISAFDRVRFRHEVFPEDEIVFEAGDAASSGTLRFTIKRGETIVADGLLRIRPENAGVVPSPGASISPVIDPALPPVEMLLPHRGTMRFLQGLVGCTAAATTGIAFIESSSPLSRGSTAPNAIAIEIAAQAAAAAESLTRFRESGVAAPREGRLVGASDVTLHSAGLPLGCPLVVSIALAHSVSPMSIYEATVADGQQVLVSGRVSTYLV